MAWFVQIVNAIPGTKFTSHEFFFPFAQGVNQAPYIIWAGASLGVVPHK